MGVSKQSLKERCQVSCQGSRINDISFKGLPPSPKAIPAPHYQKRLSQIYSLMSETPQEEDAD